MRKDYIGTLRPSGKNLGYGTITVTATATAIPTTPLADRKAIMIRNWSSDNYIYIGDASVTSSTGFPLLPKESLPFDITAGALIYGICETGKTAEVRYLEIDCL